MDLSTSFLPRNWVCSILATVVPRSSLVNLHCHNMLNCEESSVQPSKILCAVQDAHFRIRRAKKWNNLIVSYFNYFVAFSSFSSKSKNLIIFGLLAALYIDQWVMLFFVKAYLCAGNQNHHFIIIIEHWALKSPAAVVLECEGYFRTKPKSAVRCAEVDTGFIFLNLFLFIPAKHFREMRGDFPLSL